MKFGDLIFDPLESHLDKVADVVASAVHANEFNAEGLYVASIDETLADTSVFCERYGIALDDSANCIIVQAKRGNLVRYAACLVLSSDKLDVNGKLRQHLQARKVSFASREDALRLTKMEYGGITPLGLSENMLLVIDERVLDRDLLVIGSGIRGSKALAPASQLAQLQNVDIVDIHA